MSTLHIDKIVCKEAQGDGLFDNTNEVYFTLKDMGGTTGPVTTKIYGGINTGDERAIGETYSYTDYMRLSFVEDDGPGAGDDDDIGNALLPHPENPLHFTNEGADYYVYYHIT